MKRIVVAAVVALSAALVMRDASAQTTYVSNMAESDDAAQAIRSGVPLAARFVTGNDSPFYALDSVQLDLNGINGVPGGVFFVSIYNNDTGEPGTSIGTLVGSTDPAAPGDYTYTATGITLLASTDYWLVAGWNDNVRDPDDPDVFYYWTVTSSDSYSSSGGWALGTDLVLRSLNGGDTWSNSVTNFTAEMSITALPIPEPQTYFLLGLGAIVLTVARRRLTLAARTGKL